MLTFQTPKQAKPQIATWREKILQMDLLGTVLLMGSMVSLILALQWGGVTKSWGSGSVIGVLVAFGVAFLLFVANELYEGERAAIVPRLLKKKTIALISAWQIFNSGTFLLLLYYLPIYFQVVSGATAAQSGVRNLPFILGISIFTVISGVTITATGQYLPFLVLGPVLGTIGAGLLYTLGIGSPSAHWIGYQIIAGIGFGFGIQVPIIVGQAVVDPSDISSITAIIVFFQSISGAVSVSMAQTFFANKLLQEVPKYVPGLDPHLVVATGATEIRKVFHPDQVHGVILSYMAGLKDAYAFGISLAGMAAVVGILAVMIDRRLLNAVAPATSAA